MKLEGLCHCQAVKFECESEQYYPYQICYCSICRKTMGGGGSAINISADHRTLKIRKGKPHIALYHARMVDDKTGKVTKSGGQRRFCKKCGSGLWIYDPDYPELMHPFASAIDTDLPVAPEHTHLMLGSKASWVEPHIQDKDKTFKKYPKESIVNWHKRVIGSKMPKKKPDS
ncbi:MAG: GFA family protein [Proteobacteria bacterium]|nr:MAG: GFA family protein [Pseudomonadota bacterium]